MTAVGIRTVDGVHHDADAIVYGTGFAVRAGLPDDTLVGSRGYTFDPASGNTASVSFAATSQRFVRLTFTANTGWPAGQAAEFEVAAA